MDVHRGAASRGVVLTDCHGGAGQQGPMIIARSGELVWFLPVSRHGTSALRAFNLSRQHYHGEPVLCWFEGAVVDGHGQGHYVIADSSYRTIATVEAKAGLVADLHDFFLTKEDTAIFTAYGTASADLSARGGAKAGSYLYGVVQEVDLSTGKLLFSWRSDHHIGLGESYALPLPKKGPPWDYFHLNSVSLDPRDRHLIVSGRNTWAFYKVDRHSGKVLWRLGGKRSDFNLGRGCAFAYQHHVVAHRGGIYTIFDNEGAPWVHPPSRGLVLRVNEKRRTARLVQQYHHSPAVRSDALGSVQLLADGHVFIGWGTSSYFTELDPSGRVLSDGRLEGRGVESYRAFKADWTGRPEEPPVLAIRPSHGGLTLYTSWNGATEVEQWRVLAGPSKDELTAVGTAPKMGFETRIALPLHPAYVAVEALDASGRALGRSVTEHS